MSIISDYRAYRAAYRLGVAGFDGTRRVAALAALSPARAYLTDWRYALSDARYQFNEGVADGRATRTYLGAVAYAARMTARGLRAR